MLIFEAAFFEVARFFFLPIEQDKKPNFPNLLLK